MEMEVVPFDGIWGSFDRLLQSEQIGLADCSLAALDLGCGPGYPLWVLLHEYGFQNLTGVDILSEAGMLEMEKRFLPKEGGTPQQEILRNCNSIYELYRLVIQPGQSRVIKESLQPLEFFQHFNYQWETDLLGYLQGTNQEFDAIVCSNVLHFFPPPLAREILTLAKTRLKENGTLWIRVYHKESIRFQDGRFAEKVEVEEGIYEFRAKQGSYYGYDETGFKNLVNEWEVLGWEGVLNPTGEGIRFLTAICKPS